MKPLTKTANEAIVLEFEFARALETLWRPGKKYALTNFIRPTAPNGYEYECTTAGQSGNEEPEDWPTTVNDTVTDGSVVWTARAFGTNASDTISTQTVTADTGLTAATAVKDGTLITSKVSGGTLGNCYDVVCQVVTAAGETLEELKQVVVT